MIPSFRIRTTPGRRDEQVISPRGIQKRSNHRRRDSTPGSRRQRGKRELLYQVGGVWVRVTLLSNQIKYRSRGVEEKARRGPRQTYEGGAQMRKDAGQRMKEEETRQVKRNLANIHRTRRRRIVHGPIRNLMCRPVLAGRRGTVVGLVETQDGRAPRREENKRKGGATYTYQ